MPDLAWVKNICIYLNIYGIMLLILFNTKHSVIIYIELPGQRFNDSLTMFFPLQFMESKNMKTQRVGKKYNKGISVSENKQA